MSSVLAKVEEDFLRTSSGLPLLHATRTTAIFRLLRRLQFILWPCWRPPRPASFSSSHRGRNFFRLLSVFLRFGLWVCAKSLSVDVASSSRLLFLTRRERESKCSAAVLCWASALSFSLALSPSSLTSFTTYVISSSSSPFSSSARFRKQRPQCSDSRSLARSLLIRALTGVAFEKGSERQKERRRRRPFFRLTRDVPWPERLWRESSMIDLEKPSILILFPPNVKKNQKGKGRRNENADAFFVDVFPFAKNSIKTADKRNAAKKVAFISVGEKTWSHTKRLEVVFRGSSFVRSLAVALL